MVFETTKFSKPKFRICLWKNYVSFSPIFTKPSKPIDYFRNPKISNLKIQENQERLIKHLKTSTVSTNQTSCLDNQPEMLNLIRKSTLLSKQYEKLLVKNLIGADNYSLVETFFLKTQYNKVFKNQEL